MHARPLLDRLPVLGAIALVVLYLGARVAVEVAAIPARARLSDRHMWALLPVFYFAGVALARRRYA
jgi:hypothetical protein